MIPAPVAAFDTNILVSSAIAPRGNEAQAIALIDRRLVVPAISTPMLAEYRSVLNRPKFRLTPDEIEELLARFLRYGRLVDPQVKLAISPHEPDNRLLECAEAANAAFLITGNLRHFPATHGLTRILNAKSFLDLLTP